MAKKGRKPLVSLERWKQAFHLYLQGDLTHDQIAAEIGCSTSNLRKKIEREQWRKRRQEVLDEVQRRELELLVEELASFDVDRIRTLMHLVEHSGRRLLEGVLAGSVNVKPFDLVAMSQHLSELKVSQKEAGLPQMVFETAEPSCESSTRTSTPSPSSASAKDSARKGPRSPYPASSSSS